jgi:hypothetical protein
VTVDAPLDGSYVVQVYGYAAGSYQFSMGLVTGGAGLSGPLSPIQAQDFIKTPLSEPALAPDHGPSTQVAVPVASIPGTGWSGKLFLPHVRR